MMSMRRLILSLVLSGELLGLNTGFGQASYVFQNYFSVYSLDAPVFDASGNRLAGTDYFALLYGGPTPDELQRANVQSGNPMIPVPFTYMPGRQTGYFRHGGDVILDNVPCGGMAWLQVRVWDARLGASYDEVASLGLGGYGESPLFYAQGGAFCGGVPGPAYPLAGLQSFSLLPVVPEPSAAWLLLLGLPTLWFMRRRRQSRMSVL